jgi:hypothetical protein
VLFAIRVPSLLEWTAPFFSGTHFFTFFTSTKVQILTAEELRARKSAEFAVGSMFVVGFPHRCGDESGMRTSRMLTYAHVCSRIRTYAHVCARMLTYAHVCWRILTYAGACGRMLAYAVPHRCDDESILTFACVC